MGLWTREHAMTLLPAVAVMILAAILLRRWLKNKEEKWRMLPIRIIAVLLVILELGKQGTHLARGYDLYALPFHICSLALFMVPMMAFYRGKYVYTVRSITVSICTAIALLTLIYPSLIYSADNVRDFFHDFLDFHTVVFHNLVIFAFFLILTLDLHDPKGKGDARAIILFHTGFCVVSATMATVLKTNYANFYQCNIPPLENLRLMIQKALGYWPTQILYILIVSALTVLFTILSYHVYKSLRRLTCSKEEHTPQEV